MKSFQFVIFLLIACYLKDTEARWSSGECEEYPDFDLKAENYKGVWFEISKLTNSFELGQKCITAKYGDILDKDGKVDPTQVTITNSGYVKFPFWGNQSVEIGGIGRVQEGVTKNHLKINFNITLWDKVLFTTSDGMYNVIETDYENYSVVYSCKAKCLGFLGWPCWKDEVAWLLFRKNVITRETYNNAVNKLAPFTDVENLRMTDWEYCGIEETVIEN